MAEARRAGRIRVDLTLSNPTAAGFFYPQTLSTAWSNAHSLDYTPSSLGLPSARQAVLDAHPFLPPRPDRLLLTASTSEAYAFLFKLLCDAGDRVLAPAPSYPLIEHLAALEGVYVDRYPLHDAGRWTLDLGHLEASLTPRTRAIVIVAPNNPTGSVPTPDEWAALADCAARHRLPLIIDEVFAPYVFDDIHVQADAATAMSPETLVFRMGGLSKLVGLPQAKLAWTSIDGPDDLVDAALARLEMIADTYLSVSTPVQLALPALLAEGAVVRAQIQQRLRRNLDGLAARVARDGMLSLRRPHGGWTAVLRAPAVGDPDALVRTLLREGVLVHPAYFYDFAHDGYLVVSLLTPPAEFDEGLELLSQVLLAESVST